MKNLGPYFAPLAMLIIVTACVKNNSIKDILKNEVQRKKIVTEISKDQMITDNIITQLLKSNRIKEQIADNPIMRDFMNKDEYHLDCPSGKFVKFYPDGTLKETGTFRRFKFCDTVRRYHSNGAIEYEAIFNENGKEQGNVKYYYPNGQEEFVYQTKNGIPHGEASRYCENGDIKESVYYSAEGQIMRLIRHQK